MAAIQIKHIPTGYLRLDSQVRSIVEVERSERVTVMDWVEGGRNLTLRNEGLFSPMGFIGWDAGERAAGFGIYA